MTPRHPVKLALIHLLLFVFSVSLSATSKADIDLLLKARGLQAVERIEQLGKKNGNSKGKNLTKKEACEWMLENMYFAFAHPDLSKIVTRKAYKDLGKDTTAYVFIAYSGSEMAFQMNYIYKEKKDIVPLMSELSTIREGWRVKLSAALPNKLFVTGQECMITFDLQDPLKASIDTI